MVWKGMNGNIISTEGNGVWREYPSRKIVYSKPAFKTEQQRTMAEKSGRAAYIGEVYGGSNYVTRLVELSTGRPIWKLERESKLYPDGTKKVKCTKQYYMTSENRMSFLDGEKYYYIGIGETVEITEAEFEALNIQGNLEKQDYLCFDSEVKKNP